MRLLGLIGYPLSHSFSPEYFRQKFRQEGYSGWEYKAFPLQDIRLLPELLSAHPALIGFNVTYPHKESVMSYVHTLEDEAVQVGAVNTVLVSREGLVGHNTDAPAFRQMVVKHGIQAGMKAVVLGTGGAAKAVVHALNGCGVSTLLVSRNRRSGVVAYQDLEEEHLASADLVVQTTPLGMEPLEGQIPSIPYAALSSRQLVIDMIYQPAQTPFLAEADRRGARTLNGLEMLYLQAELSWNIWHASSYDLP